MAAPRTLIEGLKATPEPVDPVREREIVYGAKRNASQGGAGSDMGPARPPRKQPKAALNTRVRADFAAAVKRASLERQLRDEYPNTVQDILEEALEPWLRKNGYLT